MMRAALKGLLANKVRLTLTGLAIALGVAFVAGSFIFTDTINTRFEILLEQASVGVDIYVQPVEPEFGDVFQNSEVNSMADETQDVVQAIPGVAIAEARVTGYAQLIDKEGEPIGGQGPPTLGFSWGEVESMSPTSIEEGNGRAPQAAGEIVIDAGSAKNVGFAVGDMISVAFIGPTEEFEIVGIATFGDADSLAGATLAYFETEEARRVLGLEGRWSTISVAADHGVDTTQLTADINAQLDETSKAVTVEDANGEALDEINEALGFLNIALLAFAAVAVFVGAFIISNTFRIMVAQRTRELALFRAMGATSRQVIWMVLLEAIIVAVVASIIGIFVGIGLSELLQAGMNAAGLSIPQGPLTLLPRTIFWAMAVGIVVTAIAALLPARKASRVPPVAAMNEHAARPKRRDLTGRAIAGIVVSALGLVGLLVGLFGPVSNGILYVGIGALVFFIGVSILAPLAARPVAAALGWPLPKMFGVSGELAQQNTQRQPRRTAATASALMIGVALVVFVAIFAASIKSSVEETIFDQFAADLTASSSDFTVGFSPSFTEEIDALDETSTVSAMRSGTMKIDGIPVDVIAVDPSTIGEVLNVKPSAGAFETLGATNGLLVSENALETGVVGSTVMLEFPQDPGGTFEIVGTFEEDIFGQYIITHETYAVGFNNPFDEITFANIASDVSFEEGRAAVEAVAVDYPTVTVQTKAETVAETEQQIDQLLALFSGLLLLAIIIAVLGIANTLALSVIERTREIGLLRAVGMTRRQVRRMVRWEAVIIALFGAVMGIGIGVALGWAVVASLADEGLGAFAVPWGQLVLMVVLAGIAGIIASLWPSYKAARLNILEAIAYE